MATPIIYPGANTTAQWFATAWPGVWQVVDKFVLHTTEGFDWPGYGGGASAPNFTIKVDLANKKLIVRQHFPLNMSARALVNAPGGVNTNTDGVVQVEMIGTCDPVLAKQGAFFWPQAPDWVLRALAEVVANIHKLCGVPVKAVASWLAYPASAGNTYARMTATEWLAFSGICGHQHVPENDHGDPGNLNIGLVLTYANALLNPGGTHVALDKADATTVWTAPTWLEYGDQDGDGVRDAHTPVDMLWLTHANSLSARTDVAVARKDVADLKVTVAAQAGQLATIKAQLDAVLAALTPGAV